MLIDQKNLKNNRKRILAKLGKVVQARAEDKPLESMKYNLSKNRLNQDLPYDSKGQHKKDIHRMKYVIVTTVLLGKIYIKLKLI